MHLDFVSTHRVIPWDLLNSSPLQSQLAFPYDNSIDWPHDVNLAISITARARLPLSHGQRPLTSHHPAHFTDAQGMIEGDVEDMAEITLSRTAHEWKPCCFRSRAVSRPCIHHDMSKKWPMKNVEDEMLKVCWQSHDKLCFVDFMLIQCHMALCG